MLAPPFIVGASMPREAGQRLDGETRGVTIDRRDVNADLLPFLSYHTDEAVKGQYDETGEKLVKQADEHVTAS